MPTFDPADVANDGDLDDILNSTWNGWKKGVQIEGGGCWIHANWLPCAFLHSGYEWIGALDDFDTEDDHYVAAKLKGMLKWSLPRAMS